MPDPTNNQKQFSITRDPRISARVALPTLSTIISTLIIAFLIYAFVSGLSFQFYASFLFLFYGITKTMWVSVMLLGLFQTLLMIPFRIIRVVKTNNIKEFQRTVERLEDEEKQGFTLKTRFREGNVTFLFYAVDFVMQLVSYVSIGRLFLTDFYSRALNPAVLYDWVPYPAYPIRDIFFKIPYPQVTESVDLGWKVVIPVWIVLVAVQMIILIARRSIRSQHGQATEKQLFTGEWTRYTSGYLLFFMGLAYFLVRHFPLHWQLSIFSGDVSIPNRTFNTVTAIATFLVLVYHGIPRILRKGRLAHSLGIDQKVIDTTQKEMFKDTLFSATLIGLGAFYITNHIPSAFELSIFTLEVISLAAPFTLDRLVLKGINVTRSSEDNKEDVIHEFGSGQLPAEKSGEESPPPSTEVKVKAEQPETSQKNPENKS
ncbi:MAG: hypothetical protein UX28_C0003G0138 [Candidatus Pacebacteria bacterium GW2011_GWA1_46_10]|nr:MAG: hypothetical protein UX28_C0003G0138 [Candidatus Pacebacteria bacterium GW2011_GWA1_46_10]HCR81584.1 hypothetical protein [Candidatus Paceibacterota bacterium]